MGTRGSRATLYTGAVNAAQIPLDVADMIINPELGMSNDQSALFVLSQKMNKKRVVKNPRYDVFEQTLNTRHGTLFGVVAGSGQTLTFPASNLPGFLVKGSLLYVPRTGERILTLGDPTATTVVSCVRNVGGLITGSGTTTAEGDGLGTVSGDIVIHIGNANGEGGYSTTAIAVNTEQAYNYTQIERTAADITGTLMETEMYCEENPDAAELKRQGIEHKLKMERAMWFGGRSVRQEATYGKALRTFGGVLSHIAGNNLDISGAAYGGVLTAKVLDEFCEMVFENGSDTKVLFCGKKFASVCASMLRQLVRVDDKATSYGVVMHEYESPHGRLLIVPHKKIFDMEATYLAGTAVALDLAYIRYVTLQNRDTKLYQGILNMQRGGYDGKKSEYITEFGLEMTGWALGNSNAASSDYFRSVHGKITGFSAR